MKEVSTGSCCRTAAQVGLRSSSGPREGEVSSSCFEAAQYPASLLRTGELAESAEARADRVMILIFEVCCHLETAAVTFAGDNLTFFGRRGYEQEGRDTQPKVKRP